jgi:hypothetical protein
MYHFTLQEIKIINLKLGLNLILLAKLVKFDLNLMSFLGIIKDINLY